MKKCSMFHGWPEGTRGHQERIIPNFTPGVGFAGGIGGMGGELNEWMLHAWHGRWEMIMDG